MTYSYLEHRIRSCIFMSSAHQLNFLLKALSKLQVIRDGLYPIITSNARKGMKKGKKPFLDLKKERFPRMGTQSHLVRSRLLLSAVGYPDW